MKQTEFDRRKDAPLADHLVCPGCGGRGLYRSKLRWSDLPFALIRLRPFRCHRCSARTRRFQ